MGSGWNNVQRLSPIDWKCGYCNKEVGGEYGYASGMTLTRDAIYICPRCGKPTVFLVDSLGEVHQYPRPSVGREFEGLPDIVSGLYDEIRRCIQNSAPTSAILSMRKLLMHLAVDAGAEPGKKFFEYVKYLDEKGWIPPNSKDCLESIRNFGNEATHEIVLFSDEDAERLLGFIEIMLVFTYEFPLKLGNMKEKSTHKDAS